MIGRLIAATLAVPVSLGFMTFSFGQDIIENPATPLAKNAGRVLKLEEVWRITDESGEFFFRYPTNLRLSADGCIFLSDENEILKFSPDGKFQKNLFRKGQGPGEISSGFFYTLKNDRNYIYDFMAIKIVQTDLDGNFIGQMRIATGPYNGFNGIYQDQFVFRKEIFPAPADRKPGLQNMSVLIKLVVNDGTSETTKGSFLKEMYIEGSQFTTWTQYRSILDEQNGVIYVSPTRQYCVEVVDLKTGRTAKRIKRDYPSVKYRERGWEETFYKTHDVPRIKIESDISDLFLNGSDLWVKTSTTTPKMGDMYDVFDRDGRFIDNFYLGPGLSLLRIQGDILFSLEKDAEDNYCLVKYKIRA
jgi:hypothetical protein